MTLAEIIPFLKAMAELGQPILATNSEQCEALGLENCKTAAAHLGYTIMESSWNNHLIKVVMSHPSLTEQVWFQTFVGNLEDLPTFEEPTSY
jgi:hypothetical protein